MIRESRRGSGFPRLNSMLFGTFSRQCEKAKKMAIDFYIFETYIIMNFISREDANVHFFVNTFDTEYCWFRSYILY